MVPIVVDTNVLVAALRSRRGASFALLKSIGVRWAPLISVPLILEYEAVGERAAGEVSLPPGLVDAIVRAFCFYGIEADIYFRVRPFLPDPSDEFLLELAIAGSADAIVTYNVKHFPGVDRFGIRVLTPRDFLERIKAGHEQEHHRS